MLVQKCLAKEANFHQGISKGIIKQFKQIRNGITRETVMFPIVSLSCFFFKAWLIFLPVFSTSGGNGFNKNNT